MKVFTTHLHHNLIVKMKDEEDKDTKEQQNKYIGLKSLNVFDYLKSLSQEAKDLMDEIRD